MSRTLSTEFDSSEDDHDNNKKQHDLEATLPRLQPSTASSSSSSKHHHHKSPRQASSSKSPRTASNHTATISPRNPTTTTNIPQGTLLPPIVPSNQPPPIPPDIGDDDVKVSIKTYDKPKSGGGRRRKGKGGKYDGGDGEESDSDDAFMKFVGKNERLLSPRSGGGGAGSRKNRSDIGYIKADAKRVLSDNNEKSNAVRDLILEDIIMEKHAKETGQKYHSKLKSQIKHVDRETVKEMRRQLMHDIRAGRKLRKASDRHHRPRDLSKEALIRKVRDEVLSDIRRGHKHRLRKTGHKHSKKPKHFGLDDDGNIIKIKIKSESNKSNSILERQYRLKKKEEDLKRREEELKRKERAVAAGADKKKELLERKRQLEERQRKLEERSRRLKEKVAKESSSPK